MRNTAYRDVTTASREPRSLSSLPVRQLYYFIGEVIKTCQAKTRLVPDENGDSRTGSGGAQSAKPPSFCLH